MNVVLMAKSYAGNPHVRFDEGKVASYPPTVGRPEGVAMRGAKPRHGSLLYSRESVFKGNVCFAVFFACVTAVFGMAYAEERHLAENEAVSWDEVDGELVLSGAGNTSLATIGRLTASGRLVVESDVRVVISNAVEGSSVFLGERCSAEVLCGQCRVTGSLDDERILGARPALWLDASDAKSLEYYDERKYTNDFPLVRAWYDCRGAGWTDVYGLNNRGDNQQQVYPYAMTNVQNGRTVLSMGAVAGTPLPKEYGPGYETTENRRLPFNGSAGGATPGKSVAAEFVVMVFGSQAGGGIAVLGGGNYTRGKSGRPIEERTAASSPIFYQQRQTWLDGVSIDPTTTGFSGGYQVLSFSPGEGGSVNALGMNTAVDDSTLPCGGQNYAEVLLYTNVLTKVERISVERKLARKWGIVAYAKSKSRLRVGAGAKVTVDDLSAIDALDGEGEVRVTDDGGGTVPDGCFSGCLDFVGGQWLFASEPVPESVGNLATDSRVGWFDPSDEASVVKGSPGERELSVFGVLDRGNPAGAYLHGTWNGSAQGTDRRPWLSTLPAPWRASGTLGWLDFRARYEGDTKGKVLRFATDHSKIKTDDYAMTPLQMRAVFVALDTSRGGGMPISDSLFSDGLIRRRAPAHDASAKIWATDSTPRVRDGSLRLDGDSRDPKTSGFTGRREVMSVFTSSSYPPLPFGYVGDLQNEPNDELIGEMLVFDAIPDETVASKIEAYLMAKWCGRARTGFASYGRATLEGEGSVTARSPSALPRLGTTFGGNVSLTDEVIDVAIDPLDAQPALAAPALLTLPTNCRFRVSFSSCPRAGRYPLFTATALAGAGTCDWRLESCSGVDADRVGGLVVSETSIEIEIKARGLVLVFR